MKSAFTFLAFIATIALFASPGDKIIPYPKEIKSEFSKLELSEGNMKIFFTPEAKENNASEAARRALITALKREGDTVTLKKEGPKVSIFGGLTSHSKVIDKLDGQNLELPPQGYIIKILENTGDSAKVLVAGADWKGLAYGFATLGQLISQEDGSVFLNIADIVDYPDWRERYMSDDTEFGNIDRFYSLVANKISGFAWQYRADWRNFTNTPAITAHLNAMKKFNEDELLDFMFLIHVYVTPNNERKFDISNDDDIQMLIEKCAMVAENRVNSIMICVDDYTRRVGGEYTFFNEEEAKSFNNSIGKAHGYLMKRLYDALTPRFPELKLSMVGAPYSVGHGIGTPEIDKYVIEWAKEAPEEIMWVWTGPDVCSDLIVMDDYNAFKKLLPNHELFVWDNSNMFERPMSRWNTEFYPEMADDSNGIIYLNDRIFYTKWAWALPYSLTANDYLWNMVNYNPDRSYRAVMELLFGDSAVESIVDLRKKLVAADNALTEGSREQLNLLLPELETAFTAFKQCKDRNNSPLPTAEIQGRIDKMHELLDTVVPKIEVPKTDNTVIIDGIIMDGEWSGAVEIVITPRDGSTDANSPTCKLMYSHNGLYLAFDIPQNADLPEMGEQPHDSSVYLNADSIAMIIQPSPSGAYGQWCFDYAGNKFDEPDGEGGFMWNPDWNLAVNRNNGTWTAEAFIPFIELEQLGPVAPAQNVMWRVNFHRIDNVGKKLFSWSRGGENFHSTQFFGELIFK